MWEELVKIHLFPLWVWRRYRWIVSTCSYGYLFIVKRKNKLVRENKEQLLLFWGILWSPGNEVLWHTASIFCVSFPTLRSFPRFSPTSIDWSDLACMRALEKEMATYSSILAWRIPGTAEPGGLPSMGSHRVGRDWSDLAAAAAAATAAVPTHKSQLLNLGKFYELADLTDSLK